MRPRRKLIGVDAIEEVQRERRQQAVPRDRHIQPRLLNASLGHFQVRTASCRAHPRLFHRGQQRRLLQIVLDIEIRVVVRKNDHGERDLSLGHTQPGFLQISLPLAQINLALQHVHPSHLAAFLLLGGDVHEPLGLCNAAFEVSQMTIGRDDRIVILNDRRADSPCRDLRPGPCHCLSGERAIDLAMPQQQP